ncbi:MAG: DUF2442 domain-containing protein [Candidatus Aminicenantes bacterium]|jgi:hypothetical protein
MNTLVSEPLAKTIKFDSDTMWVGFADGSQLGVPLAYFLRLLHASPAKRGKYTISRGDTGLHWDALDEELSVFGLLLGVGDRTRTSLAAKKKAS